MNVTMIVLLSHLATMFSPFADQPPGLDEPPSKQDIELVCIGLKQTKRGFEPPDCDDSGGGLHAVSLREESDLVGRLGVDALAKQLTGIYDTRPRSTYDKVFLGFSAVLPPRAVAELRGERPPSPRLLQVLGEAEVDTVIRWVNAARRIRGACSEDVDCREDAPRLLRAWGLDRINQETGRDGNRAQPGTGKGVHVFVLDSGICPDHESMAGRVEPGFTAIGDGRGTADPHGHGTHVAAIAGGLDYGVAPKVRLYPFRVLDAALDGYDVDAADGLEWILDQGVEGPAVANMSFSGCDSETLHDSIASVLAQGITCVAAGGNTGDDASQWSPGNVPGVITVGASDCFDEVAGYSVEGAAVDLFAPGSSIMSACPESDTGWQFMTGTSMAAPHVTGVAALWLERRPEATPDEVRRVLVDTATDALTGFKLASSPDLLLHSLLPK